MGLSASQSRMLTLTSRLSDLELKSQRIQEAKVRLAEQSTEASKNYMDALDAQRLKFNYYSTGSVDATIRSITESGLYRVADAKGNAFAVAEADNDTLEQYTTPAGNTLTVYSNGDVSIRKNNVSISAQVNGNLKHNVTSSDNQTNTTDYTSQKTVTDNTMNVTVSVNNGVITVTEGNNTYNITYSSDKKAATLQEKDGNVVKASKVIDSIHQGNWYIEDKDSNVFKLSGISQAQMEDTQWLFEQLNLANLFIQKYNTENEKWEDFSHNASSLFTTEDDDTGVAKAEAEYEFTMAEIQQKDKRFDLELDAIKTEHEAVNKETESVKTIVKDNIQKSFTVFS